LREDDLKRDGASPKDTLFEAAARLFYERGYRATGVDTIAVESGIGKMTLYRHFPSKDDLIVAYLRDSDRTFWEHFEANTRGASSAREKLLGFFAGLQAYAMTPACYGCPFLNVASEYPDPEYPGHRVALEHKAAVRERFRQLGEAASAREPEQLAGALMLLMDGAYMAARVFGPVPDSPAAHVAEAAAQAIARQCDNRST
jgi:AcrR family transcriptional regulator